MHRAGQWERSPPAAPVPAWPARLPEAAATLEESEYVPCRRPASLSLCTFSFVFCDAPAFPAPQQALQEGAPLLQDITSVKSAALL